MKKAVHYFVHILFHTLVTNKSFIRKNTTMIFIQNFIHLKHIWYSILHVVHMFCSRSSRTDTCP